MADCPKCRSALARRKNDFGVFWHCGRCQGSAVTLGLLRRMIPADALNGLWQRVRQESYPRKHPCPSCARRMEQVTVDSGGKVRKIDVCGSCQFVWIDDGEWADFRYFAERRTEVAGVGERIRARIEAKRRERSDAIERRSVESSVKKREGQVDSLPYLEPPAGAVVVENLSDVVPLPIKLPSTVDRPPAGMSKSARDEWVVASELKAARAEKARLREANHRRREEPVRRVKPVVEPRERPEGGWGRSPTSAWHWLPLLMGMPVEDEQPDGRMGVREKPWFTWTLALGIACVSLIAFFDLERVVEAYGLIPAEFERLSGLTWLTSFFLHGSLMHLVGNVYFLVVFGDNVERCLGTLEFFILLVLATVGGSFLHILMDPESAIPCIGASGGISGVIAFYALRFPKNQLAVMFWFLVRTFWLRLSAIWMFALWCVLQVILAGQQIAGLSLISGGAHIGGALVGIFAYLLWRINGGAGDEVGRYQKNTASPGRLA